MRNDRYIFTYVEDSNIAHFHKVAIVAETEEEARDIFYKEVGTFLITDVEIMSATEWRQWVIKN